MLIAVRCGPSFQRTRDRVRETLWNGIEYCTAPFVFCIVIASHIGDWFARGLWGLDRPAANCPVVPLLCALYTDGAIII